MSVYECISVYPRSARREAIIMAPPTPICSEVDAEAGKRGQEFLLFTPRADVSLTVIRKKKKGTKGNRKNKPRRNYRAIFSPVVSALLPRDITLLL